MGQPYVPTLGKDDPYSRAMGLGIPQPGRFESMATSALTMLIESPTQFLREQLFNVQFLEGETTAPPDTFGMQGPGPGGPMGSLDRGYNSPLVQEARAPELERLAAENPLIAAHELNKEFELIDLSFDQPTTRLHANYLAERRIRQLRLEAIIAAGPQDATQITLNLIAGFGAALTDPINVASAFLPVVATARAFTTLQRIGQFLPGGRTSRRALQGAVEGAVGAAAVEPFIYLGAADTGWNYTVYDSMLNIVFGAGGGTILQPVAGKVGDISDARGRAASVRYETNFRTVIAQILEGRPTAVSPVVNPPTPRARTPIEAAVDAPSPVAAADAPSPGAAVDAPSPVAAADAPSPGAAVDAQPANVDTSSVPVLSDAGEVIAYTRIDEAAVAARGTPNAQVLRTPDGRLIVAVQRADIVPTRHKRHATEAEADAAVVAARKKDPDLQVVPIRNKATGEIEEYGFARGVTADEALAMRQGASPVDGPMTLDDFSDAGRAEVEAVSQRMIDDAATNRSQQTTDQTAEQAANNERLAGTEIEPSVADIEQEIAAAEVASDGKTDADLARLREMDKDIEDAKNYEAVLNEALVCRRVG